MNIKDRLLSSKLVKGTAITMLGSGISKGVLIIATFCCARLLSKSEFGEFSFIRNTLITILSICAVRFGSLCTKYTVEALDNEQSKARLFLLLIFSFVVSSIIGFLLLFLPNSLLMTIFDNEQTIFYFRIVGLFLPAFMIQPLVECVLRGMMEFKRISILQISMSILFIVFIVVGIFFYDLIGAFIGLILYYLIYSIISIFFMLKHWGFVKSIFDFSNAKKENRVLYTMILPTFVTSFVDAPVYWVSQVLMARISNMEMVGSLSAVIQLRNVAFIIPSFFFSTFMAFAGKMYASNQIELYYSHFKKLIFVFAVIGLAISFFLSVFAEQCLSLYGNSYLSDIQPLYIANVSIPFFLLVSLLHIHMVVQERQRLMLAITVGCEIIHLVCFVILLHTDVVPVSSYFISQMALIVIKFTLYFCCFSKDRVNQLNTIA